MNDRVSEGDVLAGKYRVERVLGRGGMGLVVSAMHLQLDQRVAIKLLLQGASPEVTERFLREARAAVRLKSEHVARVIDVGALPEGAPYMVMEYLAGEDLSQLVRASGALPLGEAVECVLHACEAIAEAHSLGIVHRDLKPANLFRTRAADGSSTVKVLDFGISKTSEGPGEEGMGLTQTSTILGSPLYMPPEQMASARNADARSDIWSLGAILYQLLTARVPFERKSFSELVMSVNLDQPPAIRASRPEVPAALEAAVMRCLEKKPDDRFQNVAELAWAIAPFGPASARASAERSSRTLNAQGLATAASPSPGGPAAPGDPVGSGGSGSMAALSAPNVAPSPARRGVGLAILAGALVVGGVAAFLVLGRGAAVGPPSATQPAVAAPPDAAAPPRDAPAAVTLLPSGAPPPDPLPAPSAVPPALVAPPPRGPRPGGVARLPGTAVPPPAPSQPSPPASTRRPLDISLK